MKVTDLSTAFDYAAQIWATQHALRDAPDMVNGDHLDAATDLQITIARNAALAPATDAADIALKEKIAELLDHVFEDELAAKLRQSIAFDCARLGIPTAH
jgi:propanediol dehydratase large subunit